MESGPIPACQKFTQREARRARGGRGPPLPALEDRPIGMPAALVDSRDRIVDAHHGWQPFEHVPVEEERVSERTMRHHRVGNEQLAPGGIFRLIGEGGHRLGGQRVVRLAELVPAARLLRSECRHLAKLVHGVHVPFGAAVGLGEHPAVLDVGRTSGNDTLQRSDSLRILSERQIRRAEERVGCRQPRIQLNRVLERSHGLIGMTSLRERRAERHEDRRIVGGRAQKLAIDAGRIVEPTRGHRLGGRSLQGCRVRHLRCRCSRVERKHEDQR